MDYTHLSLQRGPPAPASHTLQNEAKLAPVCLLLTKSPLSDLLKVSSRLPEWATIVLV